MRGESKMRISKMRISKIITNLLCLGVVVNTFLGINKGGISYLETGLMCLAVYELISNFEEVETKKGAK